MNWMPVLPDELFSHRAPRAPSALARAPAQGSTFFSCLLPCLWLLPALASPSCQPCEQGGLELGGLPCFFGLPCSLGLALAAQRAWAGSEWQMFVACCCLFLPRAGEGDGV